MIILEIAIWQKKIREIVGYLRQLNCPLCTASMIPNLRPTNAFSTSSTLTVSGFSTMTSFFSAAADANCWIIPGSFWSNSLQQTWPELHVADSCHCASSFVKKAQVEAGWQNPFSPADVRHSGCSAAFFAIGDEVEDAVEQWDEQWPQCPPPVIWKLVPGCTWEVDSQLACIDLEYI